MLKADNNSIMLAFGEPSASFSRVAKFPPPVMSTISLGMIRKLNLVVNSMLNSKHFQVVANNGLTICGC